MYRKLFSILFVAAALIACGKTEEPAGKAAGPQLVSVTPAAGSEGIALANLDVVFTYDQNIKASPSFGGIVTISPSGKVEKVNAYGKTLTVTVSGLDYETEYTVKVAKSYVKGYKENQESAKAVSTTFKTIDAPAPPKEKPAPGVGSGGWENNTSAVLNMKTGWNLGNTLDSGNFTYKDDLSWDQMLANSWIKGDITKWETAWGQPLATRELIHMFKTAGFGVIRVPVTWAEHMDNEGNVDPAWMARVEEVVNYVLDEDLYCLLNVHHDTGTQGWLRAAPAMYDKYSWLFEKLWNQIAERFKDYGEKLIFEGYNEMLNSAGAWSVGAGNAALPVINKYAQLFVDTVRKTGGNNAHRNLVVSTYAASCDVAILDAFEIPADSATDHLIAEVHSYAPYRFAFKQEDASQQITVFDDNCANELRSIVRNINDHLCSKGVPAIIGEYGSDSSTANDTELGKQAACYVSTAKSYGIACMYWMGLTDGKDRSVPKWTKPVVKDAIINAWNGK